MFKYYSILRVSFAMLVASMWLLVSKAQVIRVAQWNIGHFSCGRADDSSILRSQADEAVQKYLALLSKVDADIISVNEYSPAFTRPDDAGNYLMAAQTVFAEYPCAVEGPKWQYNCNALFSRKMKWHKPQTKIFDYAVEKRYYQQATIRVGGKRVVVVSAHLDWDSGDSGKVYRQRQIREIIERFRNEPHVIICGDWNVDNLSEYEPFEIAGFSLANKKIPATEQLNTWPAGPAPNLPIDNIIVKGLRLSNVRVYNDAELSDHCMMVAEVLCGEEIP